MVNRVQPIMMAFATVLAVAGCTERPRTYSTADGDRVLFEEDFSGSSLSPRWLASGPGASIERGHLHVERLRNHPVWLTTPLPTNVQLEFDAWTTSDEGDIKFELAGDGQSFATTPNYRPTGYVFVFGGWNNSRSVIARLDEHAQDRVSRTDRKVRPNRRYHMVVTRAGILSGRSTDRSPADQDPDPSQDRVMSTSPLADGT